jgi:hypothetical protein
MVRSLAYLLKRKSMQQERVWELMSRKLAGEATENELQELLNMLERDPAVYYSMKIISDMWRSLKNPRREDLELAYRKHINRSGYLQAGLN